MKNSFFKKGKYFFEEPVPYDFSETEIGIKLKKKLYSGKSPFQRIDFYDTAAYGRILVLDGIVQTSEKDEFVYHEMLCQPAMFLHKNPKRILIIGGGDGGSLKEVLKHKVEKVWLLEIDEKVINLSQKYISSVSKGAFKNKRAEVVIGDGKKFIKKYFDFFDVIILDLSDPKGSASDLILIDFYKNVKKALKKNGIVSVQSGSFTCQPKLVAAIFKRLKKIFPSVEIRKAVVPIYQAGEFSFILAAKFDLKKTTFKEIDKKHKKLKLDLKYYSPEIHFATKILPKYLKEKIKS